MGEKQPLQRPKKCPTMSRRCPEIARICIAFTNFIFLVPTLALVGIAVCLNYFHKSEILDFYQLHTVHELNDAINATGLGRENFYSNGDLITMLSSMLLILMISGAIINVIIIVGCCGSCCRQEPMLGLYIGLLIFCLIVQTLAAILLYQSGDVGLLNGMIRDQAKAALNKYEGLVGDRIETFGWNFIMRRYSCCGMYRDEDFDNVDSWNSTMALGGVVYQLVRPIACCATLPNSPDVTCATSANLAGYHSQGCYDAVWNASVKHLYIGTLPLIAGFFIQIGLLVTSCYLKGKLKKNPSRVHVDRAPRHVHDPLPAKKHFYV